MKKFLTITALLITAAITTIAQTINNPTVKTREDGNTIIRKIAPSGNYTVVTFETMARSPNYWVQLNKEIYLQTDVSNAHYNYVKSENIVMAPKKQTLSNIGDRLVFRVYFKRIPPNAKSINIIERSGPSNGNVSFFNFYNVSLTQSAVNQYASGTNKNTMLVRVDTAVVPPSLYEVKIDEPVKNEFGLPDAINVMKNNNHNEIDNALKMIVPMVSNMSKTIMDTQLEYYKQPNKLAEIAKLNKAYFDALLQEGFTRDDALKIITSNSILPKPTDVNK